MLGDHVLTKFVEKEFPYDGTQLRSLFAYLDHGLLGDSIVSWVGSCDIDFAHMVDGEDLLAKAEIRGGRMVHFIVEKFQATLPEMVALQRLLASIVKDVVVDKEHGIPRFPIRREGDDVYVVLPDGEGKLSISIATVSPASGLVHFAVNVSNEGTPVKTASLEDLRFAAREFAELVLKKFSVECESIREATMKVKWVR
ncbi:DUF366 family protein [soil metagenome]